MAWKRSKSKVKNAKKSTYDGHDFQSNLELYCYKQLEEADLVHLIVEAMRRAYQDRAAYLGDPDFVDVPIKKLIFNTSAHLIIKIFLPTGKITLQLRIVKIII